MSETQVGVRLTSFVDDGGDLSVLDVGGGSLGGGRGSGRLQCSRVEEESASCPKAQFGLMSSALGRRRREMIVARRPRRSRATRHQPLGGQTTRLLLHVV